MSNSESSADNKTASTERLIDVPVAEVFAAFSDPARLAEWWGPSGFRNTFEQFEFTPGGRWVFVMHGPDGKNYPNESTFLTIESNKRIVIRHVSQPPFTLTVSLTPRVKATHLTWVQEFENAEVANRLRHIVEPANEQNLDRLEALMAER